MKRIITLAGIGLLGLGSLAACSDKVDRKGSVDNFVEAFEDLDIEVDRDCLDDVFDKYSDKELKEFDKELNDEGGTDLSPEAEQFGNEIFACANTEG